MASRKTLRELLLAADFTTEKKRRNYGEFITEKAEIEGALKEHWPVKHIWKVLHQAGRITMTYSAFARHVRKLKTPKEGMASPSATVSVKKPSTFVHNATPDPKDLF